MKATAKLWMGIVVLIILSPLGLIIPAHFKAGSAWGEWSAGEIRKLVGYAPGGLERLSSLWKAPMPGYAFKGWESKGQGNLSFAYIISALAGTAAVVMVMVFIGKMLARKDKDG